MQSQGAKPVVTLRPAPVDLRDWSTSDTLLFNLMQLNIATMLAMPFLVWTAFYTHGNLVAAILLVGAFCTAEALVYALLASSIPHSGGLYYFQSRLMSPSVASICAFASTVLGGALWMAFAGWFAAHIAVGPFLFVVGGLTGSGRLLVASSFVQSNTGVFLMILTVTVWSAVVNLFSTKAYVRLQRLCWFLGGVALAGALVLLFSLGSDSLATSAYSEALAKARDLGFDGGGSSGGIRGTLILLPVVAFSLIYAGWSVHQGGEIREAPSLRAQIVTIVAAEVITIALYVLIIAELSGSLWLEGLSAGAYLFFMAPASMPISVVPFFWFFDGRFWPGGALALSLAVMFNAWFWMWVPSLVLAASRVMLVMSMHRTLPRWLGQLTGRKPVRAVATFCCICLLPGFLFAYTEAWRLMLSVVLLDTLAFAVTCWAAVLWPFRHRELYRYSTAAPHDILGVPVISVCGAAFILFTLLVVWRFLVDRTLTLGVQGWILTLVVLGTYAVSSLVYLLVRRYRHRREGVEIEITYHLAGKN